MASIFGFRQQYKGVELKLLAEFIVVSFVGGAVGAQLLLHTPQHTFSKMIPWLMLAATLIFTFGRKVIRATRGEQGHHMSRPVALLLQLVVSVYGGFFGAGMGILMLAILTIMGYEHIHRMNALTSIFATAVNGVALVTFIVRQNRLVATGTADAARFRRRRLLERPLFTEGRSEVCSCLRDPCWELDDDLFLLEVFLAISGRHDKVRMLVLRIKSDSPMADRRKRTLSI